MTALGPRNLVIVRAGPSSLHETFLEGGEPQFDLILSTFGDAPVAPGPAIAVVRRDGGKFEAIHDLLAGDPAILERYDYVWIPDDDIEASAPAINAMFALMREHALEIAQPALSAGSHWSHAVTLRDPGMRLRFSNFIELMMPCFSAAHLARIRPLFRERRFAWGLDAVWTRTMREPAGRAAILDACAMRHVRPVGSGALYKEGSDPHSELREMLARFGLRRFPQPCVYGAVSAGGRRFGNGPRLAAALIGHALRHRRNLPAGDRRRYLKGVRRGAWPHRPALSPLPVPAEQPA